MPFPPDPSAGPDAKPVPFWWELLTPEEMIAAAERAATYASGCAARWGDAGDLRLASNAEVAAVLLARAPASALQGHPAVLVAARRSGIEADRLRDSGAFEPGKIRAGFDGKGLEEAAADLRTLFDARGGFVFDGMLDANPAGVAALLRLFAAEAEIIRASQAAESAWREKFAERDELHRRLLHPEPTWTPEEDDAAFAAYAAALRAEAEAVEAFAETLPRVRRVMASLAGEAPGKENEP